MERLGLGVRRLRNKHSSIVNNMDIDLRNDGRYSRQTMLPEIGEEGQRRLASASVLVVGAGGLGSPLLTYLTGAGVGHIGICDPDCVSLSNLQRQVLYSESEVGMPKADRARKRLQALSGRTRFSLFPELFNVANAMAIVKGFDIVADCSDNFQVRYLIDDVCRELGKAWVHGAVAGFYGQVAVFGGKSGTAYADLYPARDEMCSMEKPVLGVMGCTPGVVGAIQASEVIKLITGAGNPLDGKLFTIDLLTLRSEILEIRPVHSGE